MICTESVIIPQCLILSSFTAKTRRGFTITVILHRAVLRIVYHVLTDADRLLAPPTILPRTS